MQIDRRRALALIGLGAATPAVAQQGPLAFRHGVASGDPMQDRVILWTRLSGASGAQTLTWQVATDSGFKRVAAAGKVTAGPERDFTAKVDVTGLKPGTEYYYRFRTALPGGKTLESRVGRTKTLPAGKTKDVVLAVASCTLYPNGYFNAYRAIADLPRVDAVLHLGDYIYEYGGEGSYGMNSAVARMRPHDPPREIVSLADYRQRHAQYKADADSQAAHARAAWITSWDDHETANNSYTDGGENHDPPEEGAWADRKAAALKAYYEWMPIREPRSGQGYAEASARTFRFGDLAILMMLETRLVSRIKQLEETDLQTVDGKPDVDGFRKRLNDPNRRMMGEWQERWLDRDLSASAHAGHTWQVIGNQVVMARIAPVTMGVMTPEEQARVQPAIKRRLDRTAEWAKTGLPGNLDMWNGYPADRERLYSLFANAKARPIVLSGDSHSFWANELHDAAGNRVACEFGTTGITSPGAGEAAPGLDFGRLVERSSPEVKYNNQLAKGFVLLTLTRDQAKAEMMAVSTINSRDFKTEAVKTFVVKPEGTGVSKLAEA
jgi:alkaline phosphatase D